ncbi:MAG: hypothetical protein QM485_15920 [Flavobacteriaceae bacterium]
MRKHTLRLIEIKTILVLIVLLAGGCSSSKTNYKRQYAKAWEKVIKSEAWKNSLTVENTTASHQNVGFYQSAESSPLFDADTEFMSNYHSLVSRAYVKIISEAENANNRLKSEYENWNAKKADPTVHKNAKFKKNLHLINRKYEAHREMLQGLKSWKIFSEYGTDDLKFFKKENLKEVRSMIRKGKSDVAIIGFLVYKLADLYHFDA